MPYKDKQKLKEYHYNYRREWAKNNPEKEKMYMKKYRENNLEEIRERDKINKRIIRALNPEKSREITRRSYYKTREKRLAEHKEYYQKNKEKLIESVIRWGKNNPDKRRKYMVIESAKRRAKAKENGGSGVTRKQWEGIKEFYNHQCIYCGNSPEKLWMDHFIPLKLGGIHDFKNIVPSCPGCNVKKNGKEPNDWIIQNFGLKKLNQILSSLAFYSSAG